MGGWGAELGGGRPRAGVHYPRHVQEFEDWFRTEGDASAYLAAVRFRDTDACPRCGALGLTAQGDAAWWCKSCRRRSTVTSQTVLANTNLDLRVWLRAAWQMTNSKTGVSSLTLERSLGVSHATAWNLLHKMRVVMAQTDRSKLSGDVEIDETLVGGRDVGVGGRVKGKKQVVIVACESLSATRMGRIRARRIPDATAASIAGFIADSIEPGSILLTDGWKSYPPAVADLASRGLLYTHKATNLSAAPEPAHVYFPHVHRIAALLKRWLLGTHQGSVEPHQLDHYLDEFVYRFNRRTSRNRGLVFWRLVCDLVDPNVTATTRAVIAARRSSFVEAQAGFADDYEQERLERNRRTARARRALKREIPPVPPGEDPF